MPIAGAGFNEGASGTVASVNVSSAQIGDVVVICVNANDGTGALTINDNNGATPWTKWTLNELRNTTTGHTFALFYRRRVLGDPSTASFTLSEDNRWTCAYVLARNLDLTTIFDTAFAVQVDPDTDDIDVPSVTTNSSNAIHLTIGATDGLSNVFTTTPESLGYTVVLNDGEKLIGIAHKTIPAAATPTGVTSWHDGGVATKTGISFALREAPAATDIITPVPIESAAELGTPAIIGVEGPISEPVVVTQAFLDWLLTDPATRVVLVELFPSEPLTGWVQVGATAAYSHAWDDQAQTAIVPGGIYAPLQSVLQNGVALVSVSSAALVETTAGSYFLDQATKTLYVRTTTGSSPNVFTLIEGVRLLRTSTGPVNFPTQPYYYPIVKGNNIPEIHDEGFMKFSGASPVQSGAIAFENGDKLFDTLVRGWLWTNRVARIRFGGGSMDFVDYQLAGQLLIVDLTAGDDTATMRLRIGDLPDRGIPNWIKWGDIYGTYVDATLLALGYNVEIQHHYLAAVYGTVYDVPLIHVQTEPFGGYDQWGLTLTAGSQILELRAKNRSTGVVTAVPTTDYVVLSGYDIQVLKAWTKDTYDLYADFYNPSARHFGTIARFILPQMGITDLDVASFDQANLDAPFDLGVYVPGGPKPTVSGASILSKMCESVMGRIYRDVDGVVRAEIWDPGVDLADPDIPRYLEHDFKVWVPEPRPEPLVRMARVNYARRYAGGWTKAAEASSLAPEYRHRTTNATSIDSLLVHEHDAKIMAYRYLRRLSNPTTFVRVVERGVTAMSLRAGSKVVVSRSRAPSPNGLYDLERMEVVKIIKRLSPHMEVEMLLGDIAGLRGRIRVWGDASSPFDYASATPEARKNLMFWADANGLVGGSTEDTFEWW